MGSLLSSFWNRLFKINKNFKIVILGLANAGKTSLLYKLKLGTVVNSHPTIGSNYEEIVHNNLSL